MLPEDIRTTSRRRFLQYCAASPLLASGAFAANALEAPSKLPDPMLWAPPGSIDLIKTPKEAINVFDFEPVARQNVPPAHFGYMASGIDDEVTLRANREDFKRFQLMPHRLNDVSKVDTSIELFGTKYDSPIFVCPTGANQFFHPDGELAVARAARARQSSADAVDVVELLGRRRHQGARSAGLVPALRFAELRSGEGADQAGRRCRLSGSDGDG